MYPNIEEHIASIIEAKVPIVFTSAGNPNTWTSHLQSHGIKVVHVVSSSKFAIKSEAAGVDAVVAEGFEAGGHNGREETTTMCLIPAVCQHVHVPVIAAGGIASGKAMLAAFALGAEGVQIGSRFVASQESSAHLKYKEALIHTKEGDTEIRLKSVTPVRLLKNNFYQQVKAAEESGASPEELRQLLGKGRAKLGMFEGELDNGELEIGQVSAHINSILPAKEILNEIWQEFLFEKDQLSNR